MVSCVVTSIRVTSAKLLERPVKAKRTANSNDAGRRSVIGFMGLPTDFSRYFQALATNRAALGVF
jgi:hypothetical protein